MKQLALLSLGLFFFSCSDQKESKELVQIEKVPAEIPELDEFDYDTLRGMYKGDFGGNDIRIILNYVSGSNVIGYNIHKGLQRNLNGSVDRSGDTIRMTLNEPGDHEFDGVFQLTFLGIDEKPSGNWTPINSVSLTDKSFELEKFVRKYEDDDDISLESFIRYEPLLDTIGTYYFNEDGLCIFEYYPSDIKEGAREQKVEITGNWNIVDNTLKIEWQPNKIFGSELVLEMKQNEYEEYYLSGGGRELHFMYY